MTSETFSRSDYGDDEGGGEGNGGRVGGTGGLAVDCGGEVCAVGGGMLGHGLFLFFVF